MLKEFAVLIGYPIESVLEISRIFEKPLKKCLPSGNFNLLKQKLRNR